MLSATTPLSNKYYYLLGKILAHKEPEIANQLIVDYSLAEKQETDFSKIPLFYTFLTDQPSIQSQYTTPVELRRLFIAAMIRMYVPQASRLPEAKLKMPNGFIKQFCILFNLQSANASNEAKQVIVWDKSYDDFREAVDEMMEQIKTKPQ